jgi:hypothetical protein
VGAFEKGEKHGQGIQTYADGSRYFSSIEDSFPPIYSYAHLISSFSYEGAFKNDEPHGQGIQTNADGSRFFSSLRDSFLPIHLSCEFNIRSLMYSILLFLSYVGAFENGEWHGQGILTLACGRVLTGVFTHNELHGEVMVTNTDGSRYFFPFKDYIPSINLYYAFNFFF